MITLLQRKPYAGALLTGVLMGISFPPGFLGVLAWIGLVPLLLRLASGPHWRTVILEAVVAAGVTTVIVGYWTLFHPLISAQAASLAGLLALSLAFSIPFCMFGAPGKRATLRLRLGLFFGSSAVIEYAQFHTEIGFPWLALGHTQASLFPINQLAAYIGVPGLSLWVIAVNAMIMVTLTGSDRLRVIASSSLATLLVISLILGYAWQRLDRKIEDTYTVLAVQPSLPPEAWSDIHDAQRPLQLAELTMSHMDEAARLVIWPETTLPVLQARDESSDEYDRLASFVDSGGIPVLTGAVIREKSQSTGEETYYNSAVVLSPYVGITARYDKRIPVPFAERVPYIDRYPWLRRLSVADGGATGYGAGSRGGVIEIDGVTVGILICFESVFGRAARTDAARSPEFFVVLAQDGWWGNTPGYQQHFALTRLRAIETGRAIVQVTVTGTTGMILPDGTSVDETAWMERTVRSYHVPVFHDETPYSRLGDLPVLILGLVLCLSGFVLDLRVRRSGV